MHNSQPVPAFWTHFMTDTTISRISIGIFCLGLASGAAAASLIINHVYILGGATSVSTPSKLLTAASSGLQKIKKCFISPAARQRQSSDRCIVSKDRILAAAERRQKSGCSNHADDQPVPQKFSASPADSAAESGTNEVDEVLEEHFTRNTQFFGRRGQQQVASAFVIVVGLGGVGSHAAALLLRSGVNKLRLIDFDQVSLSSLNRHAVATRSDVGLSKAAVLERHFRAIVPEAKVEALVAMYTEEAEEQLLAGKPDYVVDAIDNIDTKVALLAGCKRRGIRVVSCAGAGAKVDPTRLRITDIAQSSADPLARSVRHKLRTRHGVTTGIDVVMSSEKPRCTLVDNTGGTAPLTDFQVIPNFRIRTIPVLGTTPAIFGLAAAAHVITQLADQPIVPEPVFSVTSAAVTTQLQRLRDSEEARFGTVRGVKVDEPEVAVLIREVWRGVSALAAAKGNHSPSVPDRATARQTGHLRLTRWDDDDEADVNNLVLLAFDEAEAHEATCLKDIRRDQPVFSAYVDKQLERACQIFDC